MRSRAVLLLLLLALVAAIVAGSHIFLFAYSPAKPDSKESSLVEIRKGEPPAEVARVLESLGAISSWSDFFRLGRLTRHWKRIKAGEYRVSPSMTPMEIFGILASGISTAHPVTIREGENIFEIAQDVASKHLTTDEAFLRACRNTTLLGSLGLDAGIRTAEGYLYPETYFLNRAMSPEEMVRQMVRKFLSIWTPEFTARAKELGFTRFQAITLASIVEKETGNPPERPLIASVFHNRLRKRMRLQSDPTSIYGIWERFRGNLTKADLQDPNPFNTYYVQGLPLGPIGSPGVEAIRATLFPAKTDYLYFVSHNNGTSEFSSSLQEHNRAVQRYQLDPTARQGKSWRDLQKRPK
jgi:UPF0755 protein